MNIWYECKVGYERQTTEGLGLKKVLESYLIDAYTVTEAESRLVENVSKQSSTGDVEIRSIKRVKFAELFLSEDEDEEDRYFRCKVIMNFVDGETGKEKRALLSMLVQSSSLLRAVERIDKELGSSMMDYDIVTVTESPIIDILKAD